MGNTGSVPFDNVKTILVLKPALDAERLQGQAAVRLIQTAAQPQGAPEPGKGTLVDARA